MLGSILKIFIVQVQIEICAVLKVISLQLSTYNGVAQVFVAMVLLTLCKGFP